jgi:hypothetical protein
MKAVFFVQPLVRSRRIAIAYQMSSEKSSETLHISTLFKISLGMYLRIRRARRADWHSRGASTRPLGEEIHFSQRSFIHDSGLQNIENIYYVL